MSRCRHHSFTLRPAVVVSSVDHRFPLSSPLVHVAPRCRCVVGRSSFPAVVTTRSRCSPLSLCRRSIIVCRCRRHSFTLRPAVVVSYVDHRFPLSSSLVHVELRCRCVVGRSSFPAVVTTRSRYAPLSLCRRSIIVFRCRRSSFTLLPAVVVSYVDHRFPLSLPLVHVAPRCRCVVGRSLFPAVVTTRSRCAPLSLCRRSINVSRCRHHSFTMRPAVVVSSVDHCFPLSSPLVHVAPRCHCVVGRSLFPAVVTTRSRCSPLSLCRRSIIASRCRHHSFTLLPAVVVSYVDHCFPLSSPLVHVAPRCRCVVGRSLFPAVVVTRSRCAPLSLCRRSIIVSRYRDHSFTLLPAVVVSYVDHRFPLLSPLVHVAPAVVVSSVDHCFPLSSPLVHVAPRCRCVVCRSSLPAVVITRSRCAPLSLCRRSIIVSRCRHHSFTLLPAVVVSYVDHRFPFSSSLVHVELRCRCVVGRSSFPAVVTTRSRCSPLSLCRWSISVSRCRLSPFTLLPAVVVSLVDHRFPLSASLVHVEPRCRCVVGRSLCPAVVTTRSRCSPLSWCRRSIIASRSRHHSFTLSPAVVVSLVDQCLPLSSPLAHVAPRCRCVVGRSSCPAVISARSCCSPLSLCRRSIIVSRCRHHSFTLRHAVVVSSVDRRFPLSSPH